MMPKDTKKANPFSLLLNYRSVGLSTSSCAAAAVSALASKPSGAAVGLSPLKSGSANAGLPSLVSALGASVAALCSVSTPCWTPAPAALLGSAAVPSACGVFLGKRSGLDSPLGGRLWCTASWLRRRSRGYECSGNLRVGVGLAASAEAFLRCSISRSELRRSSSSFSAGSLKEKEKKC
ncbi:uncharacterized protein K452DRAFT_62943 [Aplosporella prunicola CBS 121167]|uniref:Uncharacterized protein n=1 Tax=Aplosporella prunicola CBS 121167 TaxID=1176127 RepID=A0A6A6B9M4_9PEZI|nr:uncharacterized protein K452DRAFT_62943 [Aplosporella prunicola CBS 121167]KAF2139617.1 hypothetical protein K452DRAFT_62943 [Aplosporella prunicola CBS 121167]